MPVLKNLISNIRLGKERKAKDGCHSSVDEKPMLRRANARFRKRNDSSVHVRSGLGIVHNSFPIRDVIAVSRQNSFEPGQSVKDFDISPVSKRDIPVIGKPGFMKQFVVKSGEPESASEDISIECNPSSVQHVGETDSEGDPVMDRYSLEVHPVNLATAAAKSALARRSLREFKSSFNARPILRVVNADSEPELYEDEDEDAPVGEGELAKSKRRSKAQVPHIHNLDWSALSGGEALDIAEAYDAVTALKIGGGSPADSAIAMSRSGSEKRYSGKGKGKSRQRRTISGAIDAWIESQAELENDGWRKIGSSSDRMSLLSGHSSLQSARLDSDSLREQELYLAALAEAIDFEMRQCKEQEKLLADAWEIESRRYLEQTQHRDEREEEAEAKAAIEGENRLRQEQEEQQRILGEELIEQAIHEIEEQERRAEEGRLAQQRARLRDCCVCGDTMDADKFPVESPAKGCEHPPSTCKECLEAWMASEFDTKGCDGIKCPECAETLEYQEVQQAASQSTFDAYDKLATRNALGSLDEFAWCLGINCGSGQLNIENNNFMDCVSCGYKQCLRHKVPWHDGETCEQYEYRTSGQKRRDEEKKEEAMLNKLSKKCPGANCGWRIEKIDGCEHMTCKKCKHQFCWICLADHMEIKRVGNTAHKSSCKFHSTNLDLAWPFNMH